jgi:prepilin-type N-terminal cleavage/methylation domain-containing protein
MFYPSLVLRNQHSARRVRSAGFGLIELMVSISIVLIVTSVVLSRQDAFNGAVLLRAEAYEIALQLREVQLDAVSASGDSGGFRTVLGVYFNSTTGSNGLYYVFRDISSSNGWYEIGEEFGPQGKLDSRFEIREIRIDGVINPTEVSVVFERPNFDAQVYSSSGTQESGASVYIDVARKGLTGTGPDVIRTIEVTSTGQISVL